MTRTPVSGRTRLNLYFDERVLEALRRMAVQRNTTYSELVRIACRKYVIEEGGKVIQENQQLNTMSGIK